MKILIACEESATVREAFRRKGHDAWSCDLIPSRVPGNHIQRDVREILNRGWDMIIGHPPCTDLCNSGVRWLHSDPTRRAKMIDACELFLAIWNAPCQRVAIENPIMHKHAREIIKVKWSQTVQPWMFGHGECKRTCLWLRGGLPLLVPTNVVDGRDQRIHRMAPGPDRTRERSVTYQGIAEAMATQWCF